MTYGPVNGPVDRPDGGPVRRSDEREPGRPGEFEAAKEEFEAAKEYAKADLKHARDHLAARHPEGHGHRTTTAHGRERLDPKHSVVDQMKQLGASDAAAARATDDKTRQELMRAATDNETRQKLARAWGCPEAIIQKKDHSAAMNRWLHKWVEERADRAKDNGDKTIPALFWSPTRYSGGG
jgi:hypothetical protein